MRNANLVRRHAQARPLHFLGGTLVGCWLVALVTFSGFVLHFSPSDVGFLFLLIDVGVSILCGFWQATLVSILACLCLDYFFFPPLLRFTLNDPQDWIALGAFEITALVVSRISSREHRSSQEASLQRATMEHLYELSRNTLLINMRQRPGPQLVQLIVRIFSLEAVAIFDADSSTSDRAGAWRDDEMELAKECFLEGQDGEDSRARTSRRLLRSGDELVGAIVIRGNLRPLAANALASLTAITLDRHKSLEKESRIEAAHQSERLRTAVLDSLAHAVKTPLTAIQTAAAGLEEVGRLNAAQRDLLTLVEEESTQLSTLCARLLQTAKLEAEELSIRKDDIAISELVNRALFERRGHMGDHEVQVAIEGSELTVRGDGELLVMALEQYLDNAAKYAFAGTPVKVAAWESHSEVFISVNNKGPAIPIEDRERIFQRFYRSKGAVNMAAGTGIGLSSVKMAIEAHRGHAWVISNPNEGTTFYLSLTQEGRKEH
jgi:two-component system sensor histidine kinase KdpD